MLKEAFANTSLTCLSGIRVMEPEKVIQTIDEGAGFREFRKYVRKVNLRLKQNYFYPAGKGKKYMDDTE